MSRSPISPTRTPRYAVFAAIGLVVAGLLTAPSPALAAGTVPDVMVAMGDSITRAPLADGPSGGTGVNSWSTGTTASVQSHKLRIDALGSGSVTAYNVAVSGSTSAALLDQAKRAVSYQADYVTILSGANNICQATSVSTLPNVADFRADVTAAISTIVAGRPQARVLLASVPNLIAVYEAGKTSILARSVWNSLGTCAVLLADPTSTSSAATSRRAAVGQEVVAMNAALAQVCAGFSQCVYDNGAVYSSGTTLADLSSVDYFHPSLKGQARLAEVTWDRIIEADAFGLRTVTSTWAIQETSDKVSYSGTWKPTRSAADSGGGVAYSAIPDARASLTFAGTRVSVVTRLTSSSGINDVLIDGVTVGSFNGYSASTRYAKTVFVSDELPLGSHTITIAPSGSRAAASTGHNLILDAFLIEVPEGD